MSKESWHFPCTRVLQRVFESNEDSEQPKHADQALAVQLHTQHELPYYTYFSWRMLVASFSALKKCICRMYNKCKPQPDTTLASFPPHLCLSPPPPPQLNNTAL